MYTKQNFHALAVFPFSIARYIHVCRKFPNRAESFDMAVETFQNYRKCPNACQTQKNHTQKCMHKKKMNAQKKVLSAKKKKYKKMH